MVNKLIFSAILSLLVYSSWATEFKGQSYYFFNINSNVVLNHNCNEAIIDGKHSYISLFSLNAVKERKLNINNVVFKSSLMGLGQINLNQLLGAHIIWKSMDAGEDLTNHLLGGEGSLESKVADFQKLHNFKVSDRRNIFDVNACELGEIYKQIYKNHESAKHYFTSSNFEIDHTLHPNRNHVLSIEHIVGLYYAEQGERIAIAFYDNANKYIGVLEGIYKNERDIVHDVKYLITHAKGSQKVINVTVESNKLPMLKVNYGSKDSLNLNVIGVAKFSVNAENDHLPTNAVLKIPQAINAPVKSGQHVGYIEIKFDKQVQTLEVLANEDIAGMNLIERIKSNLVN